MEKVQEAVTIVLSGIDAEAMIQRRVCSGCYGQLIMVADHYETDRYHVSCPSCTDWNGGTISNLTLERRNEQARAQYREARTNLRDILPQKSEEQLMKELGLCQ